MRGFAAFPIGMTTPRQNHRIEIWDRHVGSSKCAYRTRQPQNSHLKIDVFIIHKSCRNDPQICLPGLPQKSIKIDVSCEASAKFHHVTKHHPRYAICMSPLDAALTVKSQNVAENTKRRKCWAYNQKCRSSSEHLQKVMRSSHKTSFNTFSDTSECPEMTRVPPKTAVWHPLKHPRVTTCDH